jgi:hypothetical protein
MREATFTVSPTAVYSILKLSLMDPTTTSPVFKPVRTRELHAVLRSVP